MATLRPLYVLLLVPLLPLAQPSAPRLALVDVAAAAGLKFRHVSGTPEKRYLYETTSSGCAFVDYDNDGFLDAYLVNGSSFDWPEGAAKPASALFRNNGDGTFTDVTERAGVANNRWGTGICAGDYDNDGFTDLYVTNFGPNRLYHNNGDGTFTDVAQTAGVADRRWSAGCAFGDYDSDGYIDLYVANYVDFDLENPVTTGPFCSYRGFPVACGPRGLKGSRDRLYHNNGDGTFADVTDAAGRLDAREFYGLGVVWGDYDNDGDLDLYVANDSNPSYLYQNQGDGTFRDVALEAGVAYSEDGREQASMGVDWGDYDNDGHLDLYRTNFSFDSNTLFRNNGNGSFTDVTWQAGHGAATYPFLGWGTKFVDIDNDGRLDLFVANGHIYPQVDVHRLDTTYRQRNQLFINQDGKRFLEMGARLGPGMLLEKASRGCAVGDYDNDGDSDILVNACDGAPTLLRNDGGNRNHWVRFQLAGTRSNRSAIGARVKISCRGISQIAEVSGGSSYASQSDLRLLFGVGSATLVESVTVRWPAGLTERFSNLAVDRTYSLKEGAGLQK